VRKIIVIVLAAVLLVGASVGATWYVVGGGSDTGWSTRDETKLIDYLQSPGYATTPERGRNPITDEEAACTLEVYERYFSTYEEWNDSGDSPTLLKANATATRRCF
jgi:hypothetical protein